MKKILFVSLCVATLMSCGQKQGQSKQKNEERMNSVVSETEAVQVKEISSEENSKYLLKPNVVYKGEINGGFDGLTGVLRLGKENNKTSFEIKAYKDGGITFSFDNKVFVEGWGFNMSGTVEGKWKMDSFSYHDVEYSYLMIETEDEIMPTYYEDSNHTPSDYHVYRTFYVILYIDKELNVYMSKDDMKNNTVACRLYSE